MTVIYGMVEGHLIGVETGRTTEVFAGFLKRLSPETASGIEQATSNRVQKGQPEYALCEEKAAPNAVGIKCR